MVGEVGVCGPLITLEGDQLGAKRSGADTKTVSVAVDQVVQSLRVLMLEYVLGPSWKLKPWVATVCGATGNSWILTIIHLTTAQLTTIHLTGGGESIRVGRNSLEVNHVLRLRHQQQETPSSSYK